MHRPRVHPGPARVAVSNSLRRSSARSALLFIVLCGASAARGEDDALGNWFNDPFLKVRSALPDCPTPFGPLLRRSQMVSEEHSRVERGTSCWLAKKCEQPNAYFYDAHIGEVLSQRFAQGPEFADTTLWITVKRRFVWVEGCSGADVDAILDRFVRDTPNVEQVFVDVRHGAQGHVPYRVLTPADASAIAKP